MRLLSTLVVAGLAVAQSSTSSTGSSMTSADSSTFAGSTSTSPDYTITALPAVQSAPPCVFNCLGPIGLADPSGCDDVSEDCACLSAPNDVLDFLTECVNTVCASSTSLFGASATSLYESYCTSVYGNATFSQAFVAESSADAAAASSSSATVEASTTSGSSTTLSPTASPAASSTGKSGSVVWSPSLFTVSLTVFGGLASLIVL